MNARHTINETHIRFHVATTEVTKHWLEKIILTLRSRKYKQILAVLWNDRLPSWYLNDCRTFFVPEERERLRNLCYEHSARVRSNDYVCLARRCNAGYGSYANYIRSLWERQPYRYGTQQQQQQQEAVRMFFTLASYMPFHLNRNRRAHFKYFHTMSNAVHDLSPWRGCLFWVPW